MKKQKPYTPRVHVIPDAELPVDQLDWPFRRFVGYDEIGDRICVFFTTGMGKTALVSAAHDGGRLPRLRSATRFLTVYEIVGKLPGEPREPKKRKWDVGKLKAQ